MCHASAGRRSASTTGKQDSKQYAPPEKMPYRGSLLASKLGCFHCPMSQVLPGILQSAEHLKRHADLDSACAISDIGLIRQIFHRNERGRA